MQGKVRIWYVGYILILVYWAMISINARYIDSSSNMFYIAVMLGWGSYVALRAYTLRGNKINVFRDGIDQNGYKFKRLFYFFIGLNILYFILSFFGLGKWFNIAGLGYNSRYIPRHAYYLFTIPIGYTFAVAAYEGFWHKLNSRLFLYTVYIIAALACIYSNSQIACRSLIIGIASLLYIKKKNIFHFALIVLATWLTCVDQSAAIMAGMVLMIFLLFPKIVSKLIGKKIRFKFIIIFLLAAVCIGAFFNELYQYIYKDANSLWRLFYWMNDFESLRKTHGIGVGFGTAYATTDLLRAIENTPKLNNHMFIRDGHTMETALFITAQHSSLVNMFYRLGVIGGFSFIFLHLRLLTWLRNLCKKCQERGLNEERDYVVWAIANFFYQFIIIVLNPGIESPVFFWGYLVFAGITVGIFYRVSALIERPNVVKRGE